MANASNDKFAYSRVVEDSKWTSANSWTFVSFSFGVMLQASFYSLAYLATGWYTIGSSLKTLLLVWPGIWFVVGIIFMGILSDRIGRKTAFFITLAVYFISTIGIVLSSNYYLVLIFLALSQVAGGGETNTVIAATPEMFPTRNRAKILYLIYSFVSIGPAIFAAVDFLSISSQVSFQRELVAISAVPLLIILLASRYKMPESIRWLEAKGRKQDAAKVAEQYSIAPENSPKSTLVSTQAGTRNPSLPIKLLVVTMLTIANVIGFGLFIFVLGPTFYPSLTSYIIFFSDLIEAIVTIAFAFVVDKLSRKWNVFGFYLGTMLTMFFITGTFGIWSHNIDVFWVLLGILNVFLALGYVALNTLKGEVWKTERRATYTGVARTFAYVLNIPATIYTVSLSLQNFSIFNSLLWTMGAAGAVIWLFKGIETGKRTSVSVTSGESPAVQSSVAEPQRDP